MSSMSTSRPASIFIASRCSADAPVTTSPGLLNIVAARSSAVCGRNSAAFSHSPGRGIESPRSVLAGDDRVTGVAVSARGRDGELIAFAVQ